MLEHLKTRRVLIYFALIAGFLIWQAPGQARLGIAKLGCMLRSADECQLLAEQYSAVEGNSERAAYWSRKACRRGVASGCRQLAMAVTRFGRESGDAELLRNACLKGGDPSVCAQLAKMEPQNKPLMTKIEARFEHDCRVSPEHCGRLVSFYKTTGDYAKAERVAADVALLCTAGVPGACPPSSGRVAKRPAHAGAPAHATKPKPVADVKAMEATNARIAKARHDNFHCDRDADCTLQFGPCKSSVPIRADRASTVNFEGLDSCAARNPEPTKPEGTAACREGFCVVLP